MIETLAALLGILLRRRTLSAANVLGFGAGIGSFEVFFLLERAITLVGHVSSRVLLYVALRARWPLPAAAAVLSFTCVDGVASFGHAAGWDWDSVAVRVGLLLSLAVTGAFEAAVAWWAWRTARDRGGLAQPGASTPAHAPRCRASHPRRTA